MSLPEGNVATPPDSSIANVGSPEILDHLGVGREVLLGGKVNLVFRRAKRGINLTKEILHHCPLEGAPPCGRGGVAILISVFIHVEAVYALAVQTHLIDHAGGIGVLGHRTNRKDPDKGSSLLGFLPDSAHNIQGKLKIKL